MPSGRPLSVAASAHNPVLPGPAFESGMSFRLARLLGFPATNVPITRTGGLVSRFGRQTLKCVSRRRSKSAGNIHTPSRSIRIRYRRVIPEANENFVNSHTPADQLFVDFYALRPGSEATIDPFIPHFCVLLRPSAAPGHLIYCLLYAILRKGQTCASVLFLCWPSCSQRVSPSPAGRRLAPPSHSAVLTGGRRRLDLCPARFLPWEPIPSPSMCRKVRSP